MHSKLYMVDTGLFVSMLEDGTQFDILQGNLYGYKGAIFENLIADIFTKMKRKLYYFRKDSGLEVDFVIRYKGECVLVEVKAKDGNTKSTKTILANPDKYHVFHAIKLGDYNVSRQPTSYHSFVYGFFIKTTLIVEKMEQNKIDEMFMRRCLQLAKNGRENAKPNPMVGAVIVSGDGRIIGEGYHVRCGEGHAEVNAFASIKPEDEHLLSQATIYVSLEPCSHYGKTPPCADLIVRKGVKRCVCGCVDPFAKVQGRGIRKIREAGIEVTVGVLEAECLELNKRFITFNTHQRPYIILKWAQTANGFLDNGGRGMAISSPFTKMLSHKLRAENDAILIGRVTDERDHSQLNVRDWSGKDPMRLVIDRHHPCFEGLDFSRGKTEVLQQIMQYLYNNKVQSLIVEGGAITHQAFLDAGLWDEIRVETLLSTSVENVVTAGTPAPMLPHNVRLISHEAYDGNVINTYERI